MSLSLSLGAASAIRGVIDGIADYETHTGRQARAAVLPCSRLTMRPHPTSRERESERESVCVRERDG